MILFFRKIILVAVCRMDQARQKMEAKRPEKEAISEIWIRVALVRALAAEMPRCV